MPSDAESALTLSKKAVQFDQLGNVQAAIYYYREAAKYLEIQIFNTPEGVCDLEQLKSAALRYSNRADILEESRKNVDIQLLSVFLKK